MANQGPLRHESGGQSMSSNQRRYPRLRVNERIRVHGMYMLTFPFAKAGCADTLSFLAT